MFIVELLVFPPLPLLFLLILLSTQAREMVLLTCPWVTIIPIWGWGAAMLLSTLAASIFPPNNPWPICRLSTPVSHFHDFQSLLCFYGDRQSRQALSIGCAPPISRFLQPTFFLRIHYPSFSMVYLPVTFPFSRWLYYF